MLSYIVNKYKIRRSRHSGDNMFFTVVASKAVQQPSLNKHRSKSILTALTSILYLYTLVFKEISFAGLNVRCENAVYIFKIPMVFLLKDAQNTSCG